MNEPAIVLVGPRASGKSALGRRLAAELGWAFVDADEELERRHGRRIAEWLPADEPGFRAAEADLVAELLAAERTVVALGGGAAEHPASRSALAAHPRVVAFEASTAALVERQRGSDRPALTELDLEAEVRTVLAGRRAGYEEASSGRWVNTDGEEEQSWRRLWSGIRNFGFFDC